MQCTMNGREEDPTSNLGTREKDRATAAAKSANGAHMNIWRQKEKDGANEANDEHTFRQTKSRHSWRKEEKKRIKDSN